MKLRKLLLLTGIVLLSAGQLFAAIAERFCDPNGGGDGLDPLGEALTDGSYDDTGAPEGEHALYAGSESFISYTHGTDPPYIYIHPGSSATEGLYTIASNPDNDTLLLVESAGSDTSGDLTTSSGPWTLAEADGTLAAGQRLNIRGTHTPGAAITFTASATANAPIMIRGYTTTIGDEGYASINMEASYVFAVDGDHLLIEGLYLYGSNTSTVVQATTPKFTTFYRCAFSNTGSADNNHNALYGDYMAVIRCWIKSATGGTADQKAAVRASSHNHFIGCYIESTGHGIHWANAFSAASVRDCVFDGNLTSGEYAIYLTASDSSNGIIISSNTAYNWDDFLNLSVMPDIGDSGVWVVTNNILDTALGYGIETADSEDVTIHCVGNASNNTAGDTSFLSGSFGDNPDIGHIDCTGGSPLTDPSNGDFSLNNTANAGALLRAGAVWGDFGDLTSVLDTDAFLDVGGVQHEDSGGGGGGQPIMGGSVVR